MSKRLAIEMIEKDDCLELLSYYALESIRSNLRIPIVETIEDMELLYDWMFKDCDAYGLILKSNGMLIGDISLFYEKDKLFVGYVLHPDYHRQGYMYEALGEVLKPYREIYAKVYNDNYPSIALLKKLGFKQVSKEYNVTLYSLNKER